MSEIQQQAEELVDEVEWQEDEELDETSEEQLRGNEAGQAFAHRHILEKMNLFIKVYREKKYSQDFLDGFLDGINEVTGGNISWVKKKEESDEE